MPNLIEEAITRFSADRTDDNLALLEHVLLAEKLIVPVAEGVEEIAQDHWDIPAICLRLEDGSGALPTFTSVKRLLTWEPDGCKYVSVTGRQVLGMARDMEAVGQVTVNHSTAPRGAIPRSEFDRLLAEPC